MKKQTIESLNLIGSSILVLEKAKDRLEFEALAIYLLRNCGNEFDNLGKGEWNPPTPCKTGLTPVPEPPAPTCVIGHHVPTPTPAPTPAPGGGTGGGSGGGN